MEFDPALIRIGLALAGFAAFYAIERVWMFVDAAPGHKPHLNLGVWILNGVMVGLVPIISGAFASVFAAERGWGLFNIVDAPAWLVLIAVILSLDALAYLLHRMYHEVQLIWPLHEFHHADPHLSVTTGVRFHPGEVALSALLRGVVIIALGAPVWAVLTFEAAFLAFSQFQHTNIVLPERWERRLNLLIVTPRYHRVHHIAERALTDSNYATMFTLWDRVGGSRSRLQLGVIGLSRDET